MTINRRAALRTIGGSAAFTLPAAAVRAAAPVARFDHGVASGDPAADGAVLWTRATPTTGTTGDIALDWHVAPAADGKPVASGRVTARAARARRGAAGAAGCCRCG